MEVNEEHVNTLLNMGFQLEDAKRSLKLSKNDLNEAVAILTDDHPTTSYGSMYDIDVEMRDTYSGGGGAPTSSTVYGPSLPPSYDEVVEGSNLRIPVHVQQMSEKEEIFEFPVANLYELENRVFTESWSIPYKKEESLGRCLLAAIHLAKDGLCDADANCSRFMYKCMPEAYNKLLTSPAVHRWGPEIQEGIYDMVQLLVDLVAIRLQHEPIPLDLLHLLAMVFNMDTEYNSKNKGRSADRASQWEELFGAGNLFAVNSQTQCFREPYGWLTDLINQFAEKKGFYYIKERLEQPGLDAASMSALFAPFGNCSDLLNHQVVQPLLAAGMEMAMQYAKSLNENDFKDKKVGNVCDMLSTMKLICLNLWQNQVQEIDNLRIEITLKMLKSAHFNARMNALKEVTKMIEDCQPNRFSRSAISQDRILDWLVEEKVLSIALEGNIDKVQYCDKIKNIVEFLGMRLSNEELTKIWMMQNGESTVVIDNIHNIISAAAAKFNVIQMENLFLLVQKSWQEEKDIMKEKLLRLIGWIGRESKNAKTAQRVLELLWELAHLRDLKTGLLELALEEHLAIINDSYTVKEPIKKMYATKCVDDIKENRWVLPALKQLLQITKGIAKTSFHKAEKGILQELNKSYDIIKQVTNSLVKFHQIAVSQTTKGRELSGSTLVDGRYTHYDYVTVHLNFLQFVLQEGCLYLHWHRARDIWDCLAGNPHACDWDKEICYDWFSKGIGDLDQETQVQLFQKELLKLDASKLTQSGFQCFKCFFENVNQHENKLKKTGSSLSVEKTDLMGLDYLWKICLNIPDNEIAEMSISLLLNVSYLNLASRFKRDPSGLHRKFIDECNCWLEMAMIPLEGSTVAATLLEATKILAALGMPPGLNLSSPSRSANLLNIERLLLIAEKYIVSVEELHASLRSIPPHGASFQGQPLNLVIICEAHKAEFRIQVHYNESVGSVRQKIARKMKLPVEQIQFQPNEKLPNRDHKLLNQLEDLVDNQIVNVKVVLSAPMASYSTSQDLSGASARLSLDQETEKMLPGVIMSNGGQVFETLYHLASLDTPRITTRARSLLKLIPTDPHVVELLDAIGQKNSRLSTSAAPAAAPATFDREQSPKLTPQSSPRRPISASNLSSLVPSQFGMRGTSPTAGQSGHPTLKYSSSNVSLNSLNSSGVRLPPKDILKNMLCISTSGISMFQVLYNLEVLSSRLMPTQRDPTTMQSAKKFCEDFLDAGGLSLIVNILQKDCIGPDVDYETRQGCYAISLQLLRFLLCGQDVTGEAFQATGGRRTSTSSTAASCLSSTGSGPASLESTPGVASKTIQTMDVNEFSEMVVCFMRVTWAAAAGKLQLATTAQPGKELTTNSMDLRLSESYSGRQHSAGSTGSAMSSGSDTETSFLHAGVCVKQKLVSSKDTYIANEALELLVTCLQLRSSLLAVFYSLPRVGDFIIDILVGSTQTDVRDKALEQLYILSQTDLSPMESTGHQQSPHQFMLQTLMKARLPFWVSSSKTRGTSYRLLRQSKQYFELKCRLLRHLSVSEQTRLQLNITRMIEDEIDWLGSFVPSEDTELKETDNTLLAGHLQSIKTMLTCENVNKEKFGKKLIQDLLHEFLFPASKIIMDSSASSNAENSFTSFVPRCSNSESRVAAYDILTELAHGNLDNMATISHELTGMHHQPNPELASQWEYMPPVDSRTLAGFVGLKNGGATCYMNSLIQQLYMTPGITEFILSLDDEQIVEDSVLYQIQQVLGHLLESKLQYYVPEGFWQVFRLWGSKVNIREQQDALDFFQALIDQLDEQIKKLGRDPIFKKNFQGLYSDQKICKDCKHRYEQEEAFFALNVTVKNATLQDSLDQFVKGELLEGENAYFCEKCGVKRNTVKRMCVKTLPPVLCIQLKRFDYDWEANRAIKFDDYFKFPLILDMEPYTAEGMAWREELAQNSSDLESSSSVVFDIPSEETLPSDAVFAAADIERDHHSSEVFARASSSLPSVHVSLSHTTNHINYELVGVVVHSGQANAGHYYSFIKERRGNYMTNPNKGKWYKFNDTVVEEFEMNEAALENECFGGKYKAKVYDNSSNSHPEERLRYWNSYLLFYERTEDVHTPVSAKKSKVTSIFRPPSEKSGFAQRQDSLKQLTELVHKGERKGLFSSKMPARIQQVVRAENLLFMKNRNVYDQDYFSFVRKLAGKNMNLINHEHYTQMCLQSLQLATKFLFNTYYRTKAKLRNELDDWESLVTSLLVHSKETCLWVIEFLSTDGSQYIKPLLLECPTKDIRVAFGKLLEKAMSSFYQHGGTSTRKSFDEIVELLLSLLTRDVPDNCRQSLQYFQVLYDYIQIGIKACSHMFRLSGFKRLMEFLIGQPTTSEQDSNNRRWSSLQSRDFGPLHATLASLILHCDVSAHRTEDVKQCNAYKPVTITTKTYLNMSPDMARFVFGQLSGRYLQEVVLALREVTTGIDQMQDMLLYCSSFNKSFSTTILRITFLQCLNAPANELKSLFQVLQQILLLEDSLQLVRLKYIMESVTDDRASNINGMLSLIRHNHTTDSRRSYQFIKFLVGLSNKCPIAKDYLLQTATKWQWAVNWLNSKMTEHYWNPQTNISNEDSTGHSFQRTISAQDTLAGATALLTELESQEQLDMDVGSSQLEKPDDAGSSKSSSPVVFTTHSPAECAEDFDTIDKSCS